MPDPPDDTIIWSGDTEIRRFEREAIIASRRSWWAAWHLLPPRRGDLALSLLAPLLEPPAPAPGERSTEAAVLVVLRSERLTVTEIEERLPASGRMVRHALRRLRDDGLVRRDPNGRYEIGEGEAGPLPPGPPSSRERALEVLAQADVDVTLDEIAAALCRSTNTANAVLRELIVDGRVVRVGKGRYRLAQRAAVAA
jgi:Mn-dependent DtxR family transcriptional regulator